MTGGSTPYRLTSTGDFMTLGAGGGWGVITGCRLAAGGAAATAQVTDGDGNVLADLAAPANYSDECDQEIRFHQKVTLNTLGGAGASVLVYVR